MMCMESAAESIALARQALTPEELAMMKSEGGFLSGDQAESGWAEPSLAELYRRSILDIRAMQQSHHKVFNPYHFGRLVEAVTRNMTSNVLPLKERFTAEAMEFIHTVTEGYLVDILERSVLNAIHAGRTLLEPKDLSLVRKIRREI